MNKQAFFDGYVNKDKLYKVLADFISDPTIKAAGLAPETLGVAGAGLGAYVGHRLSKDKRDSEREKSRPEVGKILAGSLIGGVGGSYLGDAINQQVKWSKIRELLKEI